MQTVQSSMVEEETVTISENSTISEPEAECVIENSLSDNWSNTKLV